MQQERQSRSEYQQLSLFKAEPILPSKASMEPVQSSFFDAERLCWDQGTEILTRTGWVKMHEMSYDHEVSNWHMDGAITFTKPNFILIRPRKPDEVMVSLETLRRSIRIVGTRPLVFQKGRGGEFSSSPALMIINQIGQLPVCGQALPENNSLPPIKSLSHAEIHKKIIKNSYCLRQRGVDPEKAKTEAMKRVQERYEFRYKETEELSLDECRLIGFWLGDGTVSKDGRFSMTQATAYPNIIAWVDNVLANCDYHFSRHDNSHLACPNIRWCFSRGTGFGPQKRKGILPIMPYLNKQGTDLWKNFSAKQFKAFIEGFWYADGDHGLAETIPDTKRISNTNKPLLDLIQQLGICRGFSASIGTEGRINRKPGHNQLYSINVSRFQTHAMTKYRLQIDTSPFKEEMVWCVLNHTGHLVTRRHGKVAVL
jgi:hypothetical protein